MTTGREVLLYFTYKYNSNWENILNAIKKRESFTIEELNEAKENNKNNFITILDENYPEALKCINKPPLVLFYKGDLSLLDKRDKKCKISIIGSRKCTSYGIKATRKIINELPTEYIVISGLAKGIDGVAHEEALIHNNKTIAILGDGLDKLYPKENDKLYQEIIENGGLILSEYCDEVEAKPEYFISRNRIVAALCDFLLVGESYEKSGTSITVGFALSYGKEVGCIPYEIGKKSSNNKMISEGAYLIEDAKDIIKIIN